jgi:plasmid stabilization system protein ParE
MIRLPVELHPEAEAEARDARRWYAERDAKAAAGFMAALDRAIAPPGTSPR